MYSVRDGNRFLKFDGKQLASSTSRSNGRTRWVEFQLYKTNGGQYILSRIGVSLYYHKAGCAVVARNKISSIPVEELQPGLVQCETCQPVLAAIDAVYPETPRYWAQKSDSAEGVIESLYKYDDSGVQYMTNVARQLLSDAAAVDENIAEHFFNEWVQ